MLTVVTGFSKDGYALYGQQFLETFHKCAPPDVDLVAYTAEPVPMPRGRYVLHSKLDGISEFLERNRNIPERCGRSPVRGWRHKDERVGYCYRFDAVRFCWQLFYPDHAAQTLPNDDILVWFDGDVRFHAPMDTSYIGVGLQGADLCYLGRRTHTELGFWAVRLTPVTRSFLATLTRAYKTDKVFDMPEWHSAAVFDYCLAHHPAAEKAKNLTGDDAGNVWERTPLARFSTHLKGRLKGYDPTEEVQQDSRPVSGHGL